MDDLTVLRQKNPDLADFIDLWRKKYQKHFHFSNNVDKADFYEAMLEMARHLAIASQAASLALQISVDGVSGMHISVVPN